MKRMILFAALLLLARSGGAQTSSGISIQAYDEAGESIIRYPLKVYQSGREVMTVYTDDDGEALARPLSPNEYEVRIRQDTIVRSVTVHLGHADVQSVLLDLRPPVRGFSSTGTPIYPPHSPVYSVTPCPYEENLLYMALGRMEDAVVLVPHSLGRVETHLKTSGNFTLTAEQLEAMPGW